MFSISIPYKYHALAFFNSEKTSGINLVFPLSEFLAEIKTCFRDHDKINTRYKQRNHIKSHIFLDTTCRIQHFRSSSQKKSKMHQAISALMLKDLLETVQGKLLGKYEAHHTTSFSTSMFGCFDEVMTLQAWFPSFGRCSRFAG